MKFSLVNFALIITGIVHTLPVIGVLGAGKLEALYGLRIIEPNLSLLMQHRAILFGLVAILVYWAVFDPALQSAALVIASISMLGFLLLMVNANQINGALIRVAWIDLGALLLLWAAFIWRRFDN